VRFRQAPWGTPLEERFWMRVDRSGGADGCWPWLGQISTSGHPYGRFYSQRRKYWLAHRLSWHLTNGPIPEGLFVMHRCDNPRCVNPSHLQLGTHAENMADASRKGRMRGLQGTASPAAKLTDDAVREIRRAHAAGEPDADLARRFGISKTHVGRVVRGLVWRHVDAA
jgi:hypothetical protein